MDQEKKIKKESVFSVDKPEDSLGLLLWQTTVTWQRLINNSLNAYDMSHSQFVIMAILKWFEENNHTPTQIQIARLSKLDKMTVSKTVRKMVGLGYLKRQENEKDPRAKSIFLTEKGHKIIKILAPMVERIDKGFFSKLEPNDQKHMLKLMNILNPQS